MPSFRFSVLARAGLREIAAYTLDEWGRPQANLYLDQLELFARRLADVPSVGRACDDIRPGLLRANHASHVFLFRREPEAVVVCRILHKRVLATATAPIDDDDDSG